MLENRQPFNDPRRAWPEADHPRGRFSKGGFLAGVSLRPARTEICSAPARTHVRPARPRNSSALPGIPLSPAGALGSSRLDGTPLRPVRVGVQTDSLVEIVQGLEAGDEVIASATYLLDSESNLGAAVQGLMLRMGMGLDMGGMKDSAP